MLTAIGIIVTLVIMEGLLSADNALVLAVMVKHLQGKERKKALFYGLWGAVGFRALCIGIWAFISGWSFIWVIKLVGAFYLGKLVYDHFFGKGQEDGDADGTKDEYQTNGTWLHRGLAKIGIRPTVFWTTVISVELMDIAFSLDSILAAFALSNEFWVLLVGGALGILMMRSVAKMFLALIDKIPEFEGTAFVLIGIIALKMLLGVVHNIVGVFGVHMEEIDVPEPLFFGILIITFLGTFVKHKMNKSKTNKIAEVK